MENKFNWWMIVAILAIVLLLFSGSGMMGFGGFGCGSYGYGSSGGMMSWMFGNPFGWVFGMLAMIIMWGLAIIILVYFIRMINGSLKQSQNQNGRRRNARRN